MAETANLYIRTDPETEEDAEKLFKNFGITVSDAATIFLRQSVMNGGMPFEKKLPRYNAETETAMPEGALIAGGKLQAKSYASADLDAEC